jgi:hypothetical protein
MDVLYKLFAAICGVIYVTYTVVVLRNKRNQRGYARTVQLQGLVTGFCCTGLLLTMAFVSSSARFYVVLGLGAILIVNCIATIFFGRVPPDDD